MAPNGQEEASVATGQQGTKGTSSVGRFFAGLGIVLLYLALASALVFISYGVAPPAGVNQFTPDWWKDFGVRAGIALTAVGAVVGIIVTLYSLSTQIKAAQTLEVKKGEILKGVEDRKKELQQTLEDHKKEIALKVEERKNELQRNLEDYKKDILLSVEDRKKELLGEIEELKGEINRQTEFLNRTLDVRTQSYNELFKTSAACYWELQNLAKGEFDKSRAIGNEQALAVAMGLAANLDDVDREIVQRLVQKVYYILDVAEDVSGTADEKKEKYKKIWHDNVKEFGDAMKALQDRSPFYNKRTKID